MENNERYNKYELFEDEFMSDEIFKDERSGSKFYALFEWSNQEGSKILANTRATFFNKSGEVIKEFDKPFSRLIESWRALYFYESRPFPIR